MITRIAMAGMIGLLWGLTALNQPDWHAEVGYTQLVDEFGVVADGSGISVALVEGSADGKFMPDVANGQFTDKVITQQSPGDATPSGHATGMAATFFGNTSSLTPGVTEISCFNFADWIGLRLGFGTQLDPVALDFAVSNHSYIGAGLGEAEATNILQRVDFSVEQSGMTAVVGINNGSGNPQPQLLSHCYNVIAVGKTDGNHSSGTTTFYGEGRSKPEIVAPAGTTSAATAMISSGATLLYHAADDSQATRPEVLKAILLAGATKSEFDAWERTPTQPLDLVFGAGELNVYHSYRILAGGEFPGVNEAPPIAPPDGWHYNAAAEAGEAIYYEIDLPHGGSELSVILCWNIDVIDADSTERFRPSTILADMDLRLYDSTHGFLETPVDSSLATVGNVEHLYQASLNPGRYTLEVRSDINHDYGIAWRVEPNSAPSEVDATCP